MFPAHTTGSSCTAGSVTVTAHNSCSHPRGPYYTAATAAICNNAPTTGAGAGAGAGVGIVAGSPAPSANSVASGYTTGTSSSELAAASSVVAATSPYQTNTKSRLAHIFHAEQEEDSH
mmetsp:Transcript_31807/g.53153  ORF Transcript_31807/g.53153 Transcript_31807/m.53153 type:complete len:118 (-) Transcript_31807:137-490(-)